jgi:hypothetical protein
MNNVIFGSGIVALLAKALLGPTWTIVPFYRSRFFSFNPALDDNFIIRDAKLDDFIKELLHVPTMSTFTYKRAWSVAGQLVGSYQRDLCRDWLVKIFGTKCPSQAEIYMTDRMNLFVYDVRVNQLYQQLINDNLDNLKSESAKGLISEVGDHYYIRNGIREDFDNAVSTIPLYALFKLMNVKGMDLPAKPVHYLHVKTNSLDFEGHNQVLVVDPHFSFYKVSNVAPERYLFYVHDEIHNPGVYFMAFMKSFDILDGTSLDQAIPMGEMPKLDWLEAKGIYCVGSYAQWDWCMDTGSCILRLMRYAQRGFKPFKKEFIWNDRGNPSPA